MPVAAIVLAAGASSRLGQPKQLLRYRGETLLDRAIRLAREAGASPVLAVLGAHFELICASTAQNDMVLVHNERWKQGIASSIQAGLRALGVCAPRTDAALLMGCDQPRLTSEHLRALLAAFTQQAPAAIAVSSYDGVRGVPAVFPRSMFGGLRSLRGDKGARALIERAGCPIVALEFAGGEVDIDSPEDLAQLN